jgi:hypothetical protein
MRPRGRPFEKRNRVNPNGRRGKDPVKVAARQFEREIERRWIEDVTAAAKEDTDLALGTLRNALVAPRAPWSAKIAAANSILDRGWGKAKQTIEAEHRTTIEDLVMAAMRYEEEDRKKVAGELPN